MLKYTLWECDVCGGTVQWDGDGYLDGWIHVEIRKGDYFNGTPEVDKDCCSQACANKAVLDYYSKHRLGE